MLFEVRIERALRRDEKYTYADYLQWDDGERWELIRALQVAGFQVVRQKGSKERWSGNPGHHQGAARQIKARY